MKREKLSRICCIITEFAFDVKNLRVLGAHRCKADQAVVDRYEQRRCEREQSKSCGRSVTWEKFDEHCFYVFVQCDAVSKESRCWEASYALTNCFSIWAQTWRHDPGSKFFYTIAKDIVCEEATGSTLAQRQLCVEEARSFKRQQRRFFLRGGPRNHT